MSLKRDMRSTFETRPPLETSSLVQGVQTGWCSGWMVFKMGYDSKLPAQSKAHVDVGRVGGSSTEVGELVQESGSSKVIRQVVSHSTVSSSRLNLVHLKTLVQSKHHARKGWARGHSDLSLDTRPHSDSLDPHVRPWGVRSSSPSPSLWSKSNILTHLNTLNNVVLLVGPSWTFLKKLKFLVGPKPLSGY